MRNRTTQPTRTAGIVSAGSAGRHAKGLKPGRLARFLAPILPSFQSSILPALLAAVMLGALAPRAQAAISLDSTSSGHSGTANPVTSVTWSHTVGSGSDRMLVVGVGANHGSNPGAVVIGVTYGGVAMTHVSNSFKVDPALRVFSDMWYLTAPAVGTANIVVSFSTITPNRGASCGAVSLFGVKQAAPEAVATTSTNNTSYSTSLTTVTPDAWVVDVAVMGHNATVSFTPGANQTEQWDVCSTLSSGNCCGNAGSTRLVTTPATVTNTWTASGGTRGATAMAAFAPAAPPPPSVTLAMPTNNQVYAHNASILASGTVANASTPTVTFWTNSTLSGTYGQVPGERTSPGPYTNLLGVLPAGTNYIYAKLVDGSTTAYSATNLFVVRAPPSVTVTFPTAGQSFANLSTLTATATVSHGIAPYTVTFYTNNATAVGSDSSSPYVSSSLGPLAEGTYQIYAKVEDSNPNGADTAYSTTNTFTVLPPALGVSVAGPTEYPYDVSTIACTATVGNASGSYTVQFYTNSVASGNEVDVTGSTSPYGISFGPLAPGSYNVYATVTDTGSSATSAVHTVNVLAAPTVNLAALASPYAYAAPITATSSVSGGKSPYSVQFYTNSTLEGTYQPAGSADITGPYYTVTFGTLFPGTYFIYAEVTDNYADTARTATNSFTVTSPAAPDATLTSPTDGQTFWFGSTITASSSVSGGTPPNTVQYYTNGAPAGSAVPAPYTLTLSGLPVGTYTLSATVTDAENRQDTTATNTFTVAPQPAEIFVVPPGTAGVTPAEPYAPWSKAATNILTAVDYAASRSIGTVTVSNGFYSIAARVSITNANMILRSFGNGVYGGLANASNTVVKQNNTSGFYRRVMAVTATNCQIDGFTLTGAPGQIGNTTWGDFLGGDKGAGLYMSADSLVRNCIITNNGGDNINGAGVGMTAGTVSNCIIRSNKKADGDRDGGGGVWVSGGLITHCQITDNTVGGGDFGGGVYMGGAATVRNCLIRNNTAQGQGGGVWLNTADALVESCTIVTNKADGASNAGGGVYRGNGTVRNCIVYLNSAPNNTANANYYATAGFEYSASDPQPPPTSGAGNILAGVTFENPAAKDYRLKACDAVDTGANQTWMIGATDLAGGNRLIDGDAAGDAVVDMGAYEFLPFVTLTAPTHKQVFARNDSIAATATVVNVTGVTLVTFYTNTASAAYGWAGSDSTAGDGYTLSLAGGSLPAGTNHIYAVMNATEGEFTSPVRTFIVETPPVVTVTFPTNLQSFANSSTLTAVATVSHGIAPYTVTFYTNTDATAVGTDNTAPYESSPFGPLAEGSYQIYAKVADSNPNGADTAYSTTNTFTVRAPTLDVSVTGPTEYPYDVSTIACTATVRFASSSYTVQFYTNSVASGNEVGDATNDISPYGISFAPYLAPGTNTIYATVTEGAASVTSAVHTVTVLPAPTVTLLTPAPLAQFVLDASVTSTVACASGKTPYAVTFYTNINGGAYGPAGADADTGTRTAFTNVLSSLALGTYGIYAVVTDGYGSTATSGTNIFVVGFTLPTLSHRPPSDVTTGSATFNGFLSTTGIPSTYVYVLYGQNPGAWTYTNAVTAPVGGWTNNSPISQNIGGLTAGLTYYYTILASCDATFNATRVASGHTNFITGEVTVRNTGGNAQYKPGGSDNGQFTIYRPVTCTGAVLVVSYTLSGATLSPSGSAILSAGSTSAVVTVVPSVMRANSNAVLTLTAGAGNYPYGAPANSATCTVLVADVNFVPTYPFRAVGGDSNFIIRVSGVPYAVHMYTNGGSGHFIPSVPLRNVTCLIVGGGGGGGGSRNSSGAAGGGGAGGVRIMTNNLSVAPYSIIVGGGGAGGAAGDGGDGKGNRGNSGGDSVFDTITAAGGGGGGSGAYNGRVDGLAGGSGGGGGYRLGAGGAGNTPSVTPSQGNNGGAAYNQSPYGGGGGGGAASAGLAASETFGGNGGTGIVSQIRGGTNEYFAGGGGGGNERDAPGSGGPGGGGDGGRTYTVFTVPTAGAPHTGGGGGGAGGATAQAGAAGGSGVVIVRYDITPPATTLFLLR